MVFKIPDPDGVRTFGSLFTSLLDFLGGEGSPTKIGNKLFQPVWRT